MAKKVLIVEDDRDLVNMIRIYLTKKGYECALAYDVKEAESLLKEEKPDVIVLDIMLPRKDGYTFCHELKGSPEYREIPVIMLTVRSQEEEIRRGYASGASAYITKPFEFPTLVAEIEKVFKKIK